MEKCVNITILGGAHEVGGNVVLLEDYAYDVKLFIDFGINMEKYNGEYDFREHPSSIEELITLGLIPNPDNLPIKNFYTQMFSGVKLRLKPPHRIEADPTIDQVHPSNLDGIFISHSHKDHFFGVSFVNRTIPIYTGVMTKKIIQAFYKSTGPGIDNNYAALQWKTFRTGDIITIKGLKIVPYHVDHSIPAAYGFIIYSSAGPIVYTGDFRVHGPLAHMTEEFLSEIKTNETIITKGNLTTDEKACIDAGVKVLICEGTKIHKGVIESEESVENNLETLFKTNPYDFILAKYDRIDWDRFRTFSRIAKKYGWKYIITERDAYFYHLLNQDAMHETMQDPNILNDDHIYILISGNARFDWQGEVRQLLYNAKKEHRLIKNRDLKSLEGDFFIYLTHITNELIENLNFDLNGVFISSSVDPYTEEFYDNNKSIQKKLEKYGVPSYRIHASGHATPHDLINFIKKVNPEFLIPIHTEHPEFFEKIFQNSTINIEIADNNTQFKL